MRHLIVACLALLAAAHALADDGSRAAVIAADTRYWETFNTCDMDAMGPLLTDDVEFFHDRTGLTTTRAGVVDSIRRGPCGEPGLHLRREAVAGSLRFEPLAGGYALLSGTHRFHARRGDAAETVDGAADFTIVWKAVDGDWRMHRILSYAHRPPAQ